MIVASSILDWGTDRNTTLEREADGVLGLRVAHNSPVAGAGFRVYRVKEESGGSPTNYERFRSTWNGTLNTFDLVSEAGGTGTARSMRRLVGSGFVETQSAVGLSWAITQTIATAAGAVLNALSMPAATITLTGSTQITTATGFNAVNFGRPTYSAAVATTIDQAATVYIANAPATAGVGGVTITNNYAFWVDDGATRLDGSLTVGGALLAADGSAAAPAYSFSADTDTGIFRPGANRLAFATAGTQRWEINAAGDLVATPVATQIVPGATSFALRNAANNASNVTVLDAGATSIVRGILTTQAGFSALVPSATAADQTVNAADATALDITTAAGFTYTGTVAQVRLPGVVAAAAGGLVTLTGLNLSQRTLTNPGAGTVQALTVTQLAIAGAAGVANQTGVYTWTGISLTTPSHAANGAANLAYGLSLTTGTSDGAAGSFQEAIRITGGAQTLGTQRGLDITMAAATHQAINVATGVSLFADGAVGTPGIGFSADPDTGLYRIGANTFSAVVAGASVLNLSATAVSTAGVAVLTAVAGANTRLPSATAADQTVNPANAAALDITTAAGLAYTGTVEHLRLPGVVIGAAAGNVVALTGLNLSARAFTNPGAGAAQAITVTQIALAGPAGQANLTGVYTFRGIDLTMPAQAANGAINIAQGVRVTGGATAGAAGSYQRGVVVTMAAATDYAIHATVGESLLLGGVRVTGGTAAPAADVTNTNAYLTIAAGSNAGANDTEAVVNFYRTLTVAGSLGFGGNAASVVAGVTKAVGDFYHSFGADDTTPTMLHTTAGSLYLPRRVRVGSPNVPHANWAEADNVGELAALVSGGVSALRLWGSQDAAGGNVLTSRRARGTIVAPAVTNDADAILAISAWAHTGAAFGEVGLIDFICDGASGVGSTPGLIRFSTTVSGAVGATEAARLSALGLLRTNNGISARLRTATAAAQTINPADAEVLDITSSAANAYTGTLLQLRTPGLIAGAGGDTGAIALTGINIAARAFTNPGGATALVPTVRAIDIAGPAGQANITGVYTYHGIRITTPAQAANAAANVGIGLLIAGGATAGAATATQKGVQVGMAATTDDALYITQGRLRTDGDAFIRGGNVPVVERTFNTDATVGDIVYTAAQVYGGVLLRDPAGGARADTLPTAAQIVAAIPNAAVGDTFEFVLVNTADVAEIITVGAGAGNTLVPASVTPTVNEQTRFIIRLTNVGGGTEATIIYAITSGA